MVTPVRKLTPEYVAAQLAGSCRLEGIAVSPEGEKLMAAIIRGDLSEDSVIAEIKLKYFTTESSPTG